MFPKALELRAESVVFLFNVTHSARVSSCLGFELVNLVGIKVQVLPEPLVPFFNKFQASLNITLLVTFKELTDLALYCCNTLLQCSDICGRL